VASLSLDNVPVAIETPSAKALPAVGPDNAAAPPARQPVVVAAPGNPRLFVQAGAFIVRNRADQLSWRLAYVGPTLVVEATVGAQRFYRVRIGPLGSVAEGDRVLDRVVKAGFPRARLVVD